MSLLEVEHLKTFFHTRAGVVRAVNDVSFSIEPGETLGIVGESGSGKSVTCYSLLRLIPQPPGKIESGRALFSGIDLSDLLGRAGSTHPRETDFDDLPGSDDFAQPLPAGGRSVD